MEEALSHLDKSMINIRAGKANPNMLNSIKIDYYGTLTPLSQVSNINISDARTLTINPWEKSMLQEIEKITYNNNRVGKYLKNSIWKTNKKDYHERIFANI